MLKLETTIQNIVSRCHYGLVNIVEIKTFEIVLRFVKIQVFHPNYRYL